MDDDELHEELRALGSGEQPEPDATFADALEERLRLLHGTVDGVSAPSIPTRRRALWGVAAAVVIAVAFAATITQRVSEPATRLTSAIDTSLVLPDGSIVAAVAGTDLPEGALLITGPRGSAVVGGVSIPGNSQAIIRDGTAVPVSTIVTIPPSSPAPHPASSPPTSPSTVTTAAPTTRAESPPAKPSTTTAPAPKPEPVELVARREQVRAVALRWSTYRGPDFERYVLMRTTSGSDKRDTTTIVFTTEDRGVVTFRDQLPEGTDRAAYRVLALDDSGRVVGASPLVPV